MNIDTEKYLRLIGGEYKERFDAFRTLLLEYNKKYNLTAITEEKEICYKHFLDCLAGESFFPQGACVAEVGSGAGFPSVPLAIARPDLRFTLMESTGKKCEFLKTAAEKLCLGNITVLNIRAEDGGKDETMREKFDVCTARAVARLNTLAEYCMPFVRVGGTFVAYKGICDEEQSEGERAVALLGGAKIKTARYSLPEGYGERTLVVVEKKKKTPPKYPRGNGRERRSPLV